jgi:hypothetical protein
VIPGFLLYARAAFPFFNTSMHVSRVTIQSRSADTLPFKKPAEPATFVAACIADLRAFRAAARTLK